MELSSNDMQLDLSGQLGGRHKSTSIRNSANARQQIQSLDPNCEFASPPAFPMLSPPMPVEYIDDEDEDDKGTDE